MPDMERLTRDLELHLANEKDKRIIEAYHAGLDRARKEVAVIVASAALVFVVIRAFVA